MANIVTNGREILSLPNIFHSTAEYASNTLTYKFSSKQNNKQAGNTPTRKGKALH